MSTLVGIGLDSHRLVDGRRLVIGGVQIAHDRGLDGHSDADVLTHAVIDALLGAAGLGDIGEHFPDTDERWRDADSMQLLAHVVAMLRRGGHEHRQRRLHAGHGGAQARIDSARTSASRSPRRSALDARRVNVKASTGERIGFVGRGEGVAALAIAGVQAARGLSADAS